MKLLPAMLASAVLCLTACASVNNSGVPGGPPTFSAITISPYSSNVATGTSVTLTATEINDNNPVQWSFSNAAAYTYNSGTLTPIAGSTNSILYTAPPVPPSYGINSTPLQIGQGTVVINAYAPAQYSSTPPATGTASVYIRSTTTTVTILPTAASIALGSTQQFNIFSLGPINQSCTLFVNSAVGGDDTVGTIDSKGLYHAPSVMPASGPSITITAISNATPTVRSMAYITLQ